MVFCCNPTKNFCEIFARNIWRIPGNPSITFLNIEACFHPVIHLVVSSESPPRFPLDVFPGVSSNTQRFFPPFSEFFWFFFPAGFSGDFFIAPLEIRTEVLSKMSSKVSPEISLGVPLDFFFSWVSYKICSWNSSENLLKVHLPSFLKRQSKNQIWSSFGNTRRSCGNFFQQLMWDSQWTYSRMLREVSRRMFGKVPEGTLGGTLEAIIMGFFFYRSPIIPLSVQPGILPLI